MSAPQPTEVGLFLDAACDTLTSVLAAFMEGRIDEAGKAQAFARIRVVVRRERLGTEGLRAIAAEFDAVGNAVVARNVGKGTEGR